MQETNWPEIARNLNAGLEILGLNIDNSMRRSRNLPVLTLEEYREAQRRRIQDALESVVIEAADSYDPMADYVEWLRVEGKAE